MIAIYILGVLISCLLIWKSSDYFEGSTEWIGRNLTDGVKGASINAIASSMPELFTSFIFLFFLHGSDGYSGTIGTTAGSAVFNSLIIPGAVILMVTIYMGVKHVEISKKVVTRDGLFLLLAELILIFIISTNVITWVEGLVLMMLYGAYIFILFYKRKHEPIDSKLHSEYSVTGSKAWIMLVISTIVMMISCWGLVYCVDGIGSEMGISLIFTSVVLAAAASSIPDMFISLRDAKKGNYNDALSNALGSNIFDICIAHGLPLFMYTLMYGPITMSPQTTDYSMEIRILLFILTGVTIVVFMVTRKLTKNIGILMILLYIVFISYVILRAFNISIFN